MPHALLRRLREGRHQVIWWTPPDDWALRQERTVCGLLCGSFHPLHEGHRRLCGVASELLGGAVAYELAVENADKPPLSDAEIERRCRQFVDPVAVTCRPTFAEKSLLFPGVTFVVGADTAARVVDPHFYGGDPERMDMSLRTIREQRCRFLVASRQCGGRLLQLDDLGIATAHRSLFTAIGSDVFRLDLSSTDLRSGP